MKPKPLVGLYHFTTPVGIFVLQTAGLTTSPAMIVS